MAEVYAQRLTLSDTTRDSAIEIFKDALEVWVGRRWLAERDWFETTTPATLRSDDGAIFRWEPFVLGDRSLIDFTWRHPDRTDTRISWSTRATLFADDSGVTVTVRVSNTADSPPPRELCTTRPRLVLELRERCDCTCDGEPLRTNAQLLQGAESVRFFAAYELVAPERRHPIIVLTPRADNTFVVDPKQINDEFATLGTVVCIANSDSTFALTSELGKRELSCFHGALRVYMPGFGRDANALHHPLLLPRLLGEPRSRVALAQSLALLTSGRLGNVAAIDAMRDERALEYEKERERHASMLRDQAAGARDAGEFEAVVSLYASENKQLKETNVELQEEVVELKSKVKQLLYQLSRSDERTEEISIREFQQAPDSVLAAVDLIAELYGDELAFTDSAMEAAGESTFERPGDALRALQGLAELAREAANGGLGRPIRRILGDKNLDYRRGIARSTARKLRQQHECQHNGHTYFCAEHICFGRDPDPTKSLRIYFSSERITDGVIVINHVGRHLDTNRTN